MRSLVKKQQAYVLLFVLIIAMVLTVSTLHMQKWVWQSLIVNRHLQAAVNKQHEQESQRSRNKMLNQGKRV